MKKYSFLIIIGAIALLSYSKSAKSEEPSEISALNAMLLYCLPPIVKGDDVGHAAELQNLPELPKEKAALFKQGARVFAIPQAMGSAVLITSASPRYCEVAIRQADAKRFWEGVDVYFGEKTPFKKTGEKALSDNGLEKNYTADFHGETRLLISMRGQPKENGMQGLMTFARVNK